MIENLHEIYPTITQTAKCTSDYDGDRYKLTRNTRAGNQVN